MWPAMPWVVLRRHFIGLQYMITLCFLSETCSWNEFAEVEFGPLSFQNRCNQQLPGTVVDGLSTIMCPTRCSGRALLSSNKMAVLLLH
jgi:hypothetical protein